MVAQLREAAQKPAVKPWRKPVVRKADAADTSPAVGPAPLPTMAEVKGGNLAEKGAFARRHFPTWLAYQQEHGLAQSKMLALVGASSSLWHNHAIQYAKHPERYGENPVPKEGKKAPSSVPLPEVLSPTAVAKVEAVMALAQELRQMGAEVDVRVSWHVAVAL
jgi:hypothetical protein